MTTIAYKSGIMACDSCWTDCYGLASTSLTKIVRLRSGALIGEAGDLDTREMLALLQDVKKFSDIPYANKLAEMKIDYAALLVLPNNEVYMISIENDQAVEETYKAAVWRVTKNGTAVGSGGQIAIGAMRAGRDAREAVGIACNEDPNSKSPVHVVSLLPLPPKEKPIRRKR